MELIRVSENISATMNERLVVAMGQFDGLHHAHLTLLQKATSIAKEKQCKSAVISFDPHPDFILKKRENHGYITPLKEKRDLMESVGIDYFILVHFTESVAQMSPTLFIDTFLTPLQIDTLVVGFDFRFGHKGAGQIEDLKKHTHVEVIDEIKYDNKKMGSELVRDYLESGQIRHVTNILGRYYNITGKVITGNQVGRKIGIRTANLLIDEDYHFLKKGVYAVFVKIDQKSYFGACNIGNNPSINYTEKPRLEVHILDFNETIYEKEISVDFVHFLREEFYYEDKEKLINQIKQDIIDVRTILTKEDKNI